MENKTFIFLIFLSALLSSCYKEKDIKQSDVILSFQNSPPAIPADGVSRAIISVEINKKVTDSNNSIVFSTSSGLFDIAAKNTITVAAQNITQVDGSVHKIATATLISSNLEQPAFINISIKNYAQSDTIAFTRAYPEQIHLIVDKLNYQIGNGEINVTVQLRRNAGNGMPSQGQNVSLLALDSFQKNQIGVFRNLNVQSDQTGNITNYFSLPSGTNYIGKMFFKVTVVKNANGDTLSDISQINITK